MTDPDKNLGKGWRTSPDRAVTSAADSDGLHILVADSKDAYAWRTAAVLAEPGMPADTWIGNSCVIDATHAAVAYAPRTFTNQQDLMLGGAFTAIVNLDKGTVVKLPFTASLAYFDPACNPTTHTAAFTAFRDDKTRLVTVDTTGHTVADTTADGQVTSAIPVADGAVAGLGHRLVHISRTGRTTTLATTDSVPYDIRPTGPDKAGKDTYAFLDHKGDTTAHAKVWRPGKVSTVATGKLTDLALQQSGAGGVFLTGHPQGTPKTADTGITPLNANADTQPSSLGRLAVDPVLAPGVQAGLATIADAGRAAVQAEPAPAQAPAQTNTTGDGTLTLTATATTTGKEITQRVSTPHKISGTTLSPAVTSASKAVPQNSNSIQKPAAAADGDDHDPVDTDRWCSVPRNDVNEQALQPTPNQVEWAVDMAVRGDLTSGWVTQGGWRSQIGLGTVDPQGLFPVPSLTGGGRIPAQVELGILAQESNLWQAESGAIPGQMGNPLAATAGFYGHTGTDPSDYWKIDWTKSDCGYGVGQVTDGMRMAGHEKPGETALPPTVQKAVALDYTVNIAASLQILAGKWNEVHTPGQTITVNNDDPSKPENWFTAVWNYNLGFNAPSGAPGVPWGLGWYNNPANPLYPPSRLAFMDTTLDSGANHDAAHPQDWPYEEKVMGWAAWSIDTGHSYATSGRQDWPGESGFSSAGFQPTWWLTVLDRSEIKPPLDTFCTTANACDISNPPPCETDHIDGCDQLHWWNAENTVWKPDCADTCGHESIKYQTLRTEPGRGSRLQYGTPDCTGAPAGSFVVDSDPAGTQTWSDCGTVSTQGTFQFTFYPDTAGQYEAKGDLHQIGGGYQGHFWYAHDRDTAHLGGDSGRMTILGDWKLNSPLPQDQAQVYVHIPDTGAQSKEATYQIVTPFGIKSKTISQDTNESNKWVSLGAYRFKNQPPEIKLSNSNSSGTGDSDIAWDAVAFLPGNFSGVPSITFPNPNGSAPLPDFAGPPRSVQRGGLLTLTPALRDELTRQEAVSAPARLSARQFPKPGAGPHCSAPDASGRSTCITTGRPDSAEARSMAKAVEQRQLDGIPIPSWCPGSQLTDTETRTEACLNGFSPVNIVFLVNDKEVGRATFAMMQNIQLYNNAAEMDQTLIFVPFQIDADLGAVSLNWATAADCDDCTQSPKVTVGEMVWAGPDDLHVAAQTFQTFWNGTGQEDVNFGWALTGTVANADVVTPLSLGNTYDDLTIRCDDITKGNSSPGCVFKNYTPTYTVSTDRYPAAGAYYWLMKTHNSNHFGSKANNSPLHYVPDGQSDNRKVVCPDSWTGRTETPDASCDEYAFATTQESGGAPGSGVESGNECAQFYALPIDSNTWTLRDDDNYDIPNWSEKCGRASIPLDQNTGALAPFGRTGGFVWYNRMLAGDAFWVATPGFDHCTAADTTCVMQENVS
ncbi:Tat pathway signal protein [Actinacidiphila acididurans]|uniref:Tat pathway signal protein n=1 Tax=Actinacidiphila acididurans TaxID=2784346 RepID=UPI0027DE333A|nr:Tat pathway signal protein [Actinacidiphila acididurans]